MAHGFLPKSELPAPASRAGTGAMRAAHDSHGILTGILSGFERRSSLGMKPRKKEQEQAGLCLLKQNSFRMRAKNQAIRM